jgi:hypothetical protein
MKAGDRQNHPVGLFKGGKLRQQAPTAKGLRQGLPWGLLKGGKLRQQAPTAKGPRQYRREYHPKGLSKGGKLRQQAPTAKGPRQGLPWGLLKGGKLRRQAPTAKGPRQGLPEVISSRVSVRAILSAGRASAAPRAGRAAGLFRRPEAAPGAEDRAVPPGEAGPGEAGVAVDAGNIAWRTTRRSAFFVDGPCDIRGCLSPNGRVRGGGSAEGWIVERKR